VLLKGCRGPFKGTRGIFKGPRGPLKGIPVSRIPEENADETFVMISAGGNHTAAITSMGRALCWGRDGDRRASGIPELNADETFVMISAGGGRTAAITSMGRALCWGF